MRKQYYFFLLVLLCSLLQVVNADAQTGEPIMVPSEPYETSGFFGNVVFTNGHVVNDDQVTIYYGASDEFVCGAHFSLKEIFSLLKFNHAQ